MSLASTCTLLEDCVRLYCVKLVKLGTIFLRISYSVWFQFRVDQKKNLDEICKVKVKRQPLLTEVPNSHTDTEVACGFQVVLCFISSLSSRELALMTKSSPRFGCAPTEAVPNINATASHRSVHTSPLCGPTSVAQHDRFSEFPAIPDLSTVQHFRKTIYSLFFWFSNAPFQTFTSLAPCTLMCNFYNKV